MNIHKTITASLVGLTTCSGLVLASFDSYADNDIAVDQVEITVPTACTMTGSIATGQEHTASLAPGTYSAATGSEYANGIGKTTLTTICNDNNGFSIYAIGFTADTEGTNTLVGATTGATINTKAYESTDTTSNWSMKVNKVTDTSTSYNPQNMTITNSFDNYHAVPDDYTKVAEYKSTTEPATTDTTLGAKVETTYAAYVTTNQPADTYTGKVKYVMVHPYDASAPVKPISIETAMQLAGKQKYNGYYKMQDLTGNVCSVVNVYEGDSKTQLIDVRDNQTYFVAKLLDGKCWMVENLNLTGGTELSSNDTDFDSSYTLPTTNNWIVSNDKLVLPTSAVKNTNDYDLTDSTQFSVDNYAYVFNSGNKENCGDINQDIPCYSYYSWDAATLGSGRTIETVDVDAPYSICPKGWKLPTSRITTSNPNWRTESDFYMLAHEYGLDSDDSFKESDSDFYNNAGPNTIPNFILANYYHNGSFWQDANGIYSSSTSTVYSGIVAVAPLMFSNQTVWSSHYYHRRSGLSVRCLVRQ